MPAEPTGSAKDLNVLYSAFTKAENKVGGGEGLVGIYGSMTQAGTRAIMAAMAEHACMGPDSILVDIGAGLGRPLLHAVLEQGVRRTYGVELDAVKCQKAVPFIQHTTNLAVAEGVALPKEALPKIICMGVEQLSSLEPATHVYAAWEGFPTEAMEAVGRLFARSPSVCAITVVQRSMRKQDPAEVMEELGFGPVRCVGPPLQVYMAGSRRQLNAYMFVKTEAGGVGVKDSPSKSGSTDTSFQGPSLATAPEFEPTDILNALGRMGCTSSNDSGGVAACEGSQQQPAHGHGLRKRAKAGKYAAMVGVSSEEEDQEGAGADAARPSKRARAAAGAEADGVVKAAGGRGRRGGRQAVGSDDSDVSGGTRA